MAMTPVRDYTGAETTMPLEAPASAVSWAAIIGGGVTAAAVSLILLFLGAALGLSSMSPWSYHDPETVSSFTVKSAIWLIIMQWIASGMGGYLTGRLRTRWANLHTDEVFFRDTAHGFLTWALATVLTASLLTTTAASIVGTGIHAGAVMGAGAAMGASQPGPHPDHKGPDFMGYYIDGLYRTATPAPGQAANTQEVRTETARIIFMDMKDGGSVTEADKAYLTQLVMVNAGVNQGEAAKRVDDTLGQINTAKEKMKEDAETARRTSEHIAIYLFLSMLVGAFIASTAAAIGGRQRDEF